MLIFSAICLLACDENTGVSLHLNIIALCRLTYMGIHVRTYSYIQMYTHTHTHIVISDANRPPDKRKMFFIFMKFS